MFEPGDEDRDARVSPSSLPVVYLVVIGVLVFLSPGYLGPLRDEPILGLGLIVLSALPVVLGTVIVRRKDPPTLNE